MPSSECETPTRGPKPLLTGEQLGKMMRRCPSAKRDEYAEILSEEMRAGNITTLKRVCSFLANVAQESGDLIYQRELWGPTDIQKTYEGATRLGNTEAGDGFTFRGWGIGQITGRANTLKASMAIFGDARLIEHVELLDDFRTGVKAFVHYWVSHGCNELADAGKLREITREINGKASDGPPSHHGRRQAYFDRNLTVLTSRE
jgi:putative chitinase